MKALLFALVLLSPTVFAHGSTDQDKNWDELVARGLVFPVDPIQVGNKLFCSSSLGGLFVRVRFEDKESGATIDFDHEEGGVYPANRILWIDQGPHIVVLKNKDVAKEFTVEFTHSSYADEQRLTYCRFKI